MTGSRKTTCHKRVTACAAKRKFVRGAKATATNISNKLAVVSPVLRWRKLTFRNFSLCRTWLACMVSGVCQSEHITPVLGDLRWLPVSQWVVFKMALMVWKCFHGVTPSYLSDICVPATAISGRRHLQRLALYWFQAPGLQLDNEVLQSTDQPHRTICHQH